MFRFDYCYSECLLYCSRSWFSITLEINRISKKGKKKNRQIPDWLRGNGLLDSFRSLIFTLKMSRSAQIYWPWNYFRRIFVIFCFVFVLRQQTKNVSRTTSKNSVANLISKVESIPWLILSFILVYCGTLGRFVSRVWQSLSHLLWFVDLYSQRWN